MCIACTEFLKGTLKFNEFQNALRETTQEDPAHLAEVQQALSAPPSNTDDALRDQLRTASKNFSRKSR